MNAVAYIRVSSKEQVQGTSLDSQEVACRDYAEKLGIMLPDENIFREEGESATLSQRPKLVEMLDFVKKNKGKISHCIVFRVDRLARDTYVHSAIRVKLKTNGVRFVSVSEPIGEDPTGNLMETILSGMAQFDNEVRTARTTSGMRARTNQGGWPHDSPLGYRKVRSPSGISTIEPDETADIIAKLLYEFSKGAMSVKDACDYASDIGIRAKSGKPCGWQSIKNILIDPKYAGFIKSKYTDGELRIGIHKKNHSGKHLLYEYCHTKRFT